MQYETQGEALRQRSAIELLNSIGLIDSVAANAANVERTRTETERLRALMPYVGPGAAVEIQARIADLEAKPEERAHRRALTEQALANAANQQTPTERAAERNAIAARAAEDYALRREALAAQRGEAAARLEIGREGSRLAREQFEEGKKGQVEVDFGDGVVRQMSSEAAGRLKQQGVDIVIRERGAAQTVERQERTALEKDFDEATKSEVQILRDPNSADNQAYIKDFNRKSPAPYMYIWRGDQWGWGDYTQKVPLVDDQGRTFTARDIARRAANHKPPMTPEEYVKKIFYKGRTIPSEALK